MKCLTILALLVTVCAVLLDVRHIEGKEDDFQSLGDSMNDKEDFEYSLMDSVNEETPSNMEDEPYIFKRRPGRRRYTGRAARSVGRGARRL
ncbi:Hypothetical predicted protein [Paramuricea clavata]|uniref:Uncharacterized protein n=1 Tax=Paramuricea clavata TaxID=317549 RepID=A0A6S7GPQ2_PARCT|nr:Hypothetical predicted protein [Paramuricea clavata]